MIAWALVAAPKLMPPVATVSTLRISRTAWRAVTTLPVSEAPSDVVRGWRAWFTAISFMSMLGDNGCTPAAAADTRNSAQVVPADLAEDVAASLVQPLESHHFPRDDAAARLA